MVFTELPKPGDDELKMVVIAAVTNYRDLVDNLLKEDERKGLKKNEAGYESTTVQDRTTYFLQRKGFALITPNKEIAEMLASPKRQGEGAQLGKELRAKLLTSDVGLYVNMEQVNKQYAEQIKVGKNLIQQGIKLVKEMLGKNDRTQLELLEKAIDPIFQTIEDSQALLLSAELRPAGVDFHAQVEVNKASPTGKVLAQMPVSSFKELDRLPAGQMFYTAWKANPALLRGLGGLVYGVLGDLEDKEKKAVRDALEQLFKADPTPLSGRPACRPTDSRSGPTPTRPGRWTPRSSCWKA